MNTPCEWDSLKVTVGKGAPLLRDTPGTVSLHQRRPYGRCGHEGTVLIGEQAWMCPGHAAVLRALRGVVLTGDVLAQPEAI